MLLWIVVLGERSSGARVSIDMFHKNGGRECRFVVQPAATIGVPTSANLEVKRTVNFVFFRAVNTSQVLCHGE
jgi:hypothetical protein